MIRLYLCVFIVSLQFVSVFNMCVTHGETFLSDTKSYDSLYYEIIRATADFIKLSEYGTYKKPMRLSVTHLVQ